jgi:hypothetical protein
VTLNISSASGAAGGAVGSVCSVLWDKSGNYYLDGNINGGQGIMARASGGNAFVGSYQTAGTMANVGFWNYNNTLYFGNADGNGAPSASRGYIDPSSNLYMTGALYGGAGLFVGALGSQFGVYSNPADRIMQMATGWYWDWQISSGTLMWYSPSGPLLNMRLAPDNLAWNAIGPMGGNGAYVNISDERAKTDVALATVGLAEVLKLEPINFTRIAHQPPADAMMEDGSPVPTGSHPPEIGFSAQQVGPIIPEAVRVIGSPLPDGSGTLDTDTPTLATTDTAILAAVVNAIKNIDARLVAKGI